MNLDFLTGLLRSLASLLFLLATMTSLSAIAGEGFSEGEAYELEGEQLLYRETHCQLSDSSKREVIYKDSDGRLIAFKTLDYSETEFAPSFIQYDLRSSETLSVALQNRLVTMSVVAEDQASADRLVQAEADEKLPIIIDAGFDAFVKAHWDELTGGARLRFQFPLASRSSLIELQIEPSVCSYDAGLDQCFRLEMSNWLIRLLAEPIELGYDSQLRRLNRYRGLSNIEDPNGKGLNVDIRYRYGDIPARACDLIDQPLATEQYSEYSS